MTHHHLSAEIYQRLLDDACDREAFWAIAEQHLRAVCPACDEEHLSFLGEAIGRLELEDDELTHYQKAFALGTGLNPERARHFAEVEAGPGRLGTELSDHHSGRDPKAPGRKIAASSWKPQYAP